MDATRFDRISKYFAQRRRSRHVVAEATPEPVTEAGAQHAPELLFVQSFRAGAIASSAPPPPPRFSTASASPTTTRPTPRSSSRRRRA